MKPSSPSFQTRHESRTICLLTPLGLCGGASAGAVGQPATTNATGVILHTNLGRAPLSDAALKAMGEAAGGYTNLEFDLEDGRRGSRQAHLQSLLKRLTGAEAALAVGCTERAIHNRCYKAKQKLRELLGPRANYLSSTG